MSCWISFSIIKLILVYSSLIDLMSFSIGFNLASNLTSSNWEIANKSSLVKRHYTTSIDNACSCYAIWLIRSFTFLNSFSRWLTLRRSISFSFSTFNVSSSLRTRSRCPFAIICILRLVSFSNVSSMLLISFFIGSNHNYS